MIRPLVYLNILLLSLLFFTCKHQPPETIDPISGIPGSTGRPCSNDSVYFANDILPLLNSSCALTGCHNAITKEGDVQLTDYTSIKKEVVPGWASKSKLYEVIIETGKDRMPPSPMPAFTADQIAKVKKWIDQGAKNNACDRCDTVNFKYSTAIKPLMESKCQGCHNASNPGGGIDLSTYAGANAVALNGKLYNSVNWVSGFSPMPKGAIKMPACEINQIKKWIDAGSLNN